MKTTNKLFGFLSLLMLSSALVAAWFVEPSTQIPIHWNLAFEPDSWVSKWWFVAGAPIIAIAMPATYWLLPKLEPKKYNMQASRKALAATLLSVQAFLTIAYLSNTALAMGFDVPIQRIVVISGAVMMLIFGNFMGKIRSTYMLGLRTPWTLANEQVWNKTHRLGGKLFIVAGLATLVTSFWQFSMYVMLAGLLLTAIVITGYSWWLYQQGEGRDHS